MSAAEIPTLHPLTGWSTLIKVPEGQLRGWRQRGWLIPTVVSGRIYLYSADDIDRALNYWTEERILEANEIVMRVRAVIGAPEPTEEP